MSITEGRFRAWCRKIGLADTTGLASFDLSHPAIQWLVENIDENNCVSTEETSQYEEVVSLGLDEPAIDELQCNTEAVLKLERQLSQLENDINDLTTEVYHLKDINKMLQNQQDAQSTHQRTLHAAHAKRQYLRQEEKQTMADTENGIRRQLSQLTEDVQDLAKLVSDGQAHWLLQMAVADHIEFNEEVTSFLAAASSHINNSATSNTPNSSLASSSQHITPCKRPLATDSDQGAMASTSISDSISTEALTSTSGGAGQSMQEVLAELDRLRWMYPISKQQRLSARCRAAEAIASLEVMQSAQSLAQMSPDPARLRALRQESFSLELAVKDLEGNHGIKQMWSEMQRIWDAPLHVAQYQRQLEVAQRLLETRRAKVDVLVSVAACLELVAGVSEVESTQLQQAYEVMQEVDRAAISFATVTQHRAARYTASKAALIQGTRSTLHQGDTWMHRLHQGLNPSAAPSLPSILSCCKALSPDSSAFAGGEPLSATKVLSLLASTSTTHPSDSKAAKGTGARGSSGGTSGLVTVSSLVNLVLDIHEGRESLETFISKHIFKEVPEAASRLRTAIDRLSSIIFPGGEPTLPPLVSSPEVRTGLDELHTLCEQLVAEINALVAASQKLRAPEDMWEGLPVEHHVLRRFHTQPEQLHELMKAIKLRSLKR